MSILLCIVLGINLVVAFKFFKDIFSPPILVGSGMFIASLIALMHYYTWEMEKLCLDTVIYLGGGTLFFTLSCLLFRKTINFTFLLKEKFDINSIKIYAAKIRFLLLFLLIFGIVLVYFKYREYVSFFGRFASISELLYQVRVEELFGENEFTLSPFVSIGSRIYWLLSLIIAYYFSVHLFSGKIDKTCVVLYISVLIINLVNFLFNGNKTGMFRCGVSYVFIFLFVFFKSHKINYKRNILTYLLYAFVISVVLFFVSSTFIGRGVDNKYDLFSIYFGAEIKGFDIFLQKNQDISYSLGKSTFYAITKHLHLEKTPSTHALDFVAVNNQNLGNVKTIFLHFYIDFGGIGLFAMTFLFAFLSMYVYNKYLYSFINPYKRNVWLFLYSDTVLALFMSFFSSNFFHVVTSFGFVINYILLIIFLYNFEKIFVKIYK